MFGSECTALELGVIQAFQADGLLWLSGRRPACEAMFHPRISGIWSVFLVVGDGEVGESGPPDPPLRNCSHPSASVRGTFAEFLHEPPAFVLANGAEHLWPGWADWQRLLSGSARDVSLKRLDGNASPAEILEEVKAVGASLTIRG